MGRPPKEWAALGLPPLRDYWREINRQKREAVRQQREKRKVTDKQRPTCVCKAYPWPHRPAGGLCKHPDPPTECWERKPASRPYRDRYAGLRRQIARANGLHPIRDRAAIDALIPRALELAKELKRRCPRVKYRNMEITENGLTGRYQSVGPDM